MLPCASEILGPFLTETDGRLPRPAVPQATQSRAGFLATSFPHVEWDAILFKSLALDW
jgi:hypothetical protein